MSDATPGKEFAKQLLRQDVALQSPRYQEHRMQLEQQLQRAERNEQIVYWVVVVAVVIAGAAFLWIAARNARGVDPWDRDATVLSVAVGVVYAAAAITVMFGLAAYYGRLRPATRELKEKLVLESIREIRQELRELKQQISSTQDRQQP